MTMKKLQISVLALFVSMTGITAPPQAYAMSMPVTAQAVVLFNGEANPQILYSKTPHARRAPASTTKVLTAMVAIDQLSMDQIVTIPGFVDTIEPSKMYLKPGDRYYVRDLIRATLISSANDAAEVLAHVGGGGSRARFAELMNQKARAIGARHSNFVRASGLPAEGQFSTAYDLGRIMHHSSHYPFIQETLKVKGMSVSSLGGRRNWLKNHNKMLWRDTRELIGKTGWTRRAKHCFIGYMKGPGKVVFVAMMGSRKPWADLKIMMDYMLGKSVSSVRTNRKIWGVAETRKIQLALKRAGFNPGSIDGQWGPSTIRAVKKFQHQHGLHADGVVGDNTWAKLQQYAANPRSRMKQVQQALKKAGYEPGPIDGVLGKRSTQALRAFQKSHGLTPDGVVGSFTWEKLQPYL